MDCRSPSTTKKVALPYPKKSRRKRNLFCGWDEASSHTYDGVLWMHALAWQAKQTEKIGSRVGNTPPPKGNESAVSAAVLVTARVPVEKNKKRYLATTTKQ